MHPARVLGVLAVVCAAPPALADPIGNFKSGTAVRLRVATIKADSHRRSITAIALTKPAGTLDFDLPAARLGVPLPITMHLHGEALDATLVQYSFSWSGSIDVDLGHRLTAARGTFLVRFAAVPGWRTSIGNVAAEALPYVSTITLTGSWGTTGLLVEEASFDGGYPQVRLARYARTGSSVICSSPRSPVAVPLSVDVDRPAPPSGQWVFLTSANHPALSLPTIVVVPPGKRTAAFTGTIAPSFVGAVHTIARGGGSTVTLDIHVDSHERCEP